MIETISLVLEILEKLSANQPSSHFSGSPSNIIKLCISKQSTTFILIDVSVTSKGLEALQRDSNSLLRSEEEHRCKVLVVSLSFISESCKRVNHCSGGLQRCIHVSNLTLHELKLPNRLAKLLSIYHIRDSDIEASLHNSDRTCTEDKSLVV